MNHSDRERDLSPTEQVFPKQASPLRRDSAVSSAKSVMPRTYGSRSSSESSRRKSSYDRGHRMPGPRRINSAPYGQPPQVNMQDAIAFHERSCALFRNPSLASQHPTRPNLEPVYSPRGSDAQHHTKETTYPPAPVMSYDDLNMVDEKLDVDQHDYVPPATEIRWTSDETRRRQYAEIDRANRGIRGIWKKIFPSLAAKSSRSRFYTEDDGSDGGSVRRYRLDIQDGQQ